MLTDFFATKLGMTQAWTKSGKRLAITRCKASDLPVVAVSKVLAIDTQVNTKPQLEVSIAEVGLGKKKLANMSKPLREKMTKSGFSLGAKQLRGVRIGSEQIETITPGSSISVDQVLAIGDVVQVQGVTKGRGFAGAVKRYGFHGGPKTHGQSDRTRAVGSIGPGTTPGRVFVGKKMPGRYGGETKTVTGLVVVHIDPATKEIWLSGPVPGAIFSQVKIKKTGQNKTLALDTKVSGLTQVITEKTDTANETEVEPAVVEPKNESDNQAETAEQTIASTVAPPEPETKTEAKEA